MTSGPPQARREHWFEHDQLLRLVGATDHVAVYFDPDVKDDAARWPLPYLDDVWRYTKETYGSFGPDPLFYAMFHHGRYSGGHSSTYQDASHDHRNVTDCGPGPHRADDSGVHELVTHEISQIVKGANNGAWGSPAFPVWGDSIRAELFIYDIYTALGRHQWAGGPAGLRLAAPVEPRVGARKPNSGSSHTDGVPSADIPALTQSTDALRATRGR